MKRAPILAFLMALPLGAEQEARRQPPQVSPPPRVDDAAVEKAIQNGIKWLKGQVPNLKAMEHVKRTMQQDELVLLTFVHAGVPETDPDFKALFDKMMERQLEATYCVALQAMILEELDRVKYQWRIAQCAQFLVDNQAPNGQWSYGAPSIYVEEIQPPPRATATGGKVREYEPAQPGHRAKPRVVNKIPIKKRRDGQAGDNSNTQYAALGMRACHDAGIIIPKDVTELAIKWYRNCQKDEKGAKPDRLELDGAEVREARPGATQAVQVISCEPQGWCYGKHDDHKPYGSMTAGSIGSLAIWLYIKDNDDPRPRSWKRDKDVHEGLQWLAHNFSVEFNPGPYEHGDKGKDSQAQYYYYLYALERAGIIYGTERIGPWYWYPEGAKVLLQKQGGDGKWAGGVVDTCFAILFLRRATRPLVATEAAGSKK